MVHEKTKAVNPFNVRITEKMMLAIATICVKRSITASVFARAAFMDAIMKEIYLVQNGHYPDQLIFDGEKVVSIADNDKYMKALKELIDGN